MHANVKAHPKKATTPNATAENWIVELFLRSHEFAEKIRFFTSNFHMMMMPIYFM